MGVVHPPPAEEKLEEVRAPGTAQVANILKGGIDGQVQIQVPIEVGFNEGNGCVYSINMIHINPLKFICRNPLSLPSAI